MRIGTQQYTRDVTINRESVENRFKYVTIQIGWDAKQIAISIRGRSLYECMSEGNLLFRKA